MKDDEVDRVPVFAFDSEFALEFRLAKRALLLFELVAARLLLLSLVILAMAKIRITTPMPMNTSTAPMPRIHGQTLRFWVCGGGIGAQAGGGAGGGSA